MREPNSRKSHLTLDVDWCAVGGTNRQQACTTSCTESAAGETEGKTPLSYLNVRQNFSGCMWPVVPASTLNRLPNVVREQMADLINHTARWVAKNGPEFEHKLTSSGSPEFSFLREGSKSLPAAYYRNRLRFEQEVLSSQPTGVLAGHDEPPHGTAARGEQVALEGLGARMKAEREREMYDSSVATADATGTPDEGRRKSLSLFAKRASG